MKKLTSILALSAAAVMAFTLAACKNDDNGTKTPTAESISVSGQQTQFYVGDEFSAEGLTVTVTYDDKSDKVAASTEYTVDSSAYVSTVEGDYTIIVKLNETTLETTYTVSVEEKGYEVKTDSGITLREGVSGGKTKAGNTVTFKAAASYGKHLVAVKVNGTALTADENGIYSFLAGDYLDDTHTEIDITLEQEEHTYTTTTVEAKCQRGGYTEYTCDCGDSYQGEKTDAKFLYSDLEKDWTSGVQLEIVNHTAKYTMTTDDGWSSSKRQVSLKTTDYLRFTGTGRFKVELKAEGASEGVAIIAEQTMNNKTFVVPVNSVVTKDGEYTMLVYPVGPRDSEHVVSECYVLATENEDVHEWVSVEGSEQRECDICHIKENAQTEEPENGFLYSNIDGDWTSGVKLELVNNTAKYTMTTDDGWSVSQRKITLKTTDYIRFTGTGTFKVELKAKGASEGTVIIAEQTMDNKTFVVPVNSVVTEDGEYTLLVYVVGPRDSVHIVTECCITKNAAEGANA